MVRSIMWRCLTPTFVASFYSIIPAYNSRSGFGSTSISVDEVLLALERSPEEGG